MFGNFGNRSAAPLPPGARVERQGFFRNFLNSIAGMFIGLLIVFGMCWLLFWNEVRPNPADAARMASELTSANAPRLQEQAVWVRGDISGAAVELDEFLAPDLGREFILLSRNVERWVWVEEEIRTERNRVGGGTETIITYEYHLRWSGTTPNSALFRGHNPPENPPERPGFTGFIRVTDDLSIAGFDLTGRQLSFAGAQRLFMPTAASIAGGLYFSGNHIFEYQRAITSPEVGDYRISYLYVENNTNGIVLGRLTGNNIIPLTFQSTGL
ncbi:MAG: TMEM43 family protein, partial [Treponema sp.]|nr:TMEM43 family protein [Treponema sp.]